MNRRQLQCFIAVAEELHFVRAAQRLNSTQPAVSQQIARLEEVVGAPLFDRTRRRVQLTSAGQMFLPEARLILRQMEVATNVARRASEGATGRMVLAFAEGAPFAVLPGLVSAFRRAYPSVHLMLEEMLSTDQVEALRSERIDVALMRPMPLDRETTSILIHSEPYIVALPEDHPLAVSETIDLRSLEGEAFVALSPPRSRYLEGQFRAAFARAGYTPNVAQEANRLPAIVGLVGAGLGVALVPASVAKLGMDGVRYRPLSAAKPIVAELALAWRSSDRSPIVRSFVELSQKHVRRRHG